MSVSLDNRFLEELKQKNEITEVIGGYVSLDRKGNTHWACCPFHHERTPSFAVNQAEQFYHCFGCGVSGDVIKFVREIENTDFIFAEIEFCVDVGFAAKLSFRGKNIGEINKMFVPFIFSGIFLSFGN